MESLGTIIYGKVEEAMGYIDELKTNSGSEEDKKKYEIILDAMAGLDLLYQELEGDIAEAISPAEDGGYIGEEDSRDIRDVVEALIETIAINERTMELFGDKIMSKDFENGPEIQSMMNDACEQAQKEFDDDDNY